ncbi:amidohydrolase [Dysgonomonas sp. 25]|uniref:amidohydrolase n=1 Tax=Dysgonomonas sp. 25 TaxID=2302933 RepID=UPI0013D27A73|nr:amidohydrolase [Dysgonomonas sp. 25]NDV68104.1 amidohydrolase [Dysgonomonas sp. 25]
MTETILRVTLVQLDIIWENKAANIDKVHAFIKEKAAVTDLFVLPEMFSTGFSMNSHALAESNEGNTVNKLKHWAKEYSVAICGSFIAEDGGEYYNRGFFITPEASHFYDKRHLFRMGEEANYFSAGNKRLIVEHKGFNICLLICYDLRFPVWARNVDNEYDLLVYAANWPESRSKVWNTLLEARAIENMCYVCGVNRSGTDGNKLKYKGESKLIDFKGNILDASDADETATTVAISKDKLTDFRSKFPAWRDADKFKLIY